MIYKRIIVAFLTSLIFSISTLAIEPPDLESQNAVLIDADTGQVLYNKNMHEPDYPASITKIMTGLLTAENGKLDDVVEVSKTAAFSIEPGSSHVGLVPGEQITVDQMLHAILLMSANEASNAAGEYVSGSIEAFVDLMNKRAKELGALNTNFANPNGLHNDNHYTTAYDMANIARHAILNETFRKVFGTITYQIPPTNLQEETRYFAHTHRILKNTNVFYEWAFGGKTGYTSKAGHTLVTAAKKDGRTLIAVVLRSTRDGMYTDTTKLFDYGFNGFETYKQTPALKRSVVPIMDSDEQIGYATLSTEDSYHFLVPIGTPKDAIYIKESIPEVILKGTNILPELEFYIHTDTPYMNDYMGSYPLKIQYINNSGMEMGVGGQTVIISDTVQSNIKLPLLIIGCLVILLCAYKYYVDRAPRNRWRQRKKRYGSY